MIHIYHHIWPVSAGLKIAKEQKERLYNSIKDEFIYHPNIVDIKENECHTIIKMMNEIKNYNKVDYILFIHTKGATKPNELYEIEWREYMELSLIDDYKSHIDSIEKGFDTSGVLLNYKNSVQDFMKFWGGAFYPGNFWWSRVKTFYKFSVNLEKQWKPDLQRYKSEINFFTFINKWNPATLYPSFEKFKILYEYIVNENEINKKAFENRIKIFI